MKISAVVGVAILTTLLVIMTYADAAKVYIYNELDLPYHTPPLPLSSSLLFPLRLSMPLVVAQPTTSWYTGTSVGVFLQLPALATRCGTAKAAPV